MVFENGDVVVAEGEFVMGEGKEGVVDAEVLEVVTSSAYYQ